MVKLQTYNYNVSLTFRYLEFLFGRTFKSSKQNSYYIYGLANMSEFNLNLTNINVTTGYKLLF